MAEPVYQDFFASVQRGLFIEQSYQAQLYRLVRMYVDLPALVKPLAKSGSNPILPAEVLERLREMVVASRATATTRNPSQPQADQRTFDRRIDYDYPRTPSAGQIPGR